MYIFLNLIPHQSSSLPSVSPYIPLDFLNLDQKNDSTKTEVPLPFSHFLDTGHLRYRTGLRAAHRTLSGRGWWRRETLRGVGGSHGGSAGGGETGGVRDPGWKMMENPGKTWEKRGKQGGELMRFKMDFKFFLVLRDVLVDFDGFKILQFFF